MLAELAAEATGAELNSGSRVLVWRAKIGHSS